MIQFVDHDQKEDTSCPVEEPTFHMDNTDCVININNVITNGHIMLDISNSRNCSTFDEMPFIIRLNSKCFNMSILNIFLKCHSKMYFFFQVFNLILQKQNCGQESKTQRGERT